MRKLFENLMEVLATGRSDSEKGEVENVGCRSMTKPFDLQPKTEQTRKMRKLSSLLLALSLASHFHVSCEHPGASSPWRSRKVSILVLLDVSGCKLLGVRILDRGIREHVVHRAVSGFARLS